VQPAALDVDARALGERLAASGYDDLGLGELLGAPPEVAGTWQVAPVHLAALGEDGSDRGVLARLFLLGDAVETGAAERALGPELARAPLVEEAGDGLVRSPVQVMPFQGMLFVSDPPRRGRAAADVVCPVTNAARSMSRLTLRRASRAALDLGAGNGVQGLLAARHSERVTFTDVNRRALGFCALNARLNGVEERCELVEGSWFEPLAEREFDLIVANPPFIISPDSVLEFRDGGLPRDQVSCKVVCEAAEHLSEGGVAHVMVNWVHAHGDDWSAPPRQWLAGRGCDALVLRFVSQAPEEYAALWNADLRDDDEDEYRGALRRWIEHYRETGIEAIGTGVVILRRRAAAANWVRALDLPGGISGAPGEHVERLFAGGDWLATHPDDGALLATPFALPDGLRVRQTLSRRDGRYRRHAAEVGVDPGLGAHAALDPDALGVVLGCDGERPLHEVVAGTADDLRSLVLETVRDLVARGLLEPR
jgi:methylase of polypeptide subunit release factors